LFIAILINLKKILIIYFPTNFPWHSQTLENIFQFISHDTTKHQKVIHFSGIYLPIKSLSKYVFNIHSLFLFSFPFYLVYFAFCANSFLLFSFLTVELSFPLCPWDLHKTCVLIIILWMEICNSRETKCTVMKNISWPLRTVTNNFIFFIFYFYCIIKIFVFQIKRANHPPQVMNELKIIVATRNSMIF